VGDRPGKIPIRQSNLKQAFPNEQTDSTGMVFPLVDVWFQPGGSLEIETL
jgi:hypothetical protein